MRKKREAFRRSDMLHDSAGGRVRWLLHHLWADNRLAMAQAVSISHTVVDKIAARKQEPGKKVLSAIGNHPPINPSWLLTGDGEPLLGPQGLPVMSAPVGGPVGKLQWQGTERTESADFSSPTRYWLRLRRGDPITSEGGFRAGDLLLLETDAAKWPGAPDLLNHVCVVRMRDRSEPLLAGVCYFPATMEDGPARLVLDTFAPAPASGVIRETAVRRYPDGRLEVRERRLRPPVRDLDPEPLVQYGDIVAVWTGVLLRSEFGS